MGFSCLGQSEFVTRAGPSEISGVPAVQIGNPVESATERLRKVNCSDEVGMPHHRSVLIGSETRGGIMAEVVGKLITDLHPNGTVRIVFLQHVGGGYERPHSAKSLDIAEGGIRQHAGADA